MKEITEIVIARLNSNETSKKIWGYLAFVVLFASIYYFVVVKSQKISSEDSMIWM